MGRDTSNLTEAYPTDTLPKVATSNAANEYSDDDSDNDSDGSPETINATTVAQYYSFHTLCRPLEIMKLLPPASVLQRTSQYLSGRQLRVRPDGFRCTKPYDWPTDVLEQYPLLRLLH